MGQGGISNLKETRNKTKIGSESENQALSANIDELECQIKSSNLSSSDKTAKKRQYLNSAAASESKTQPKQEPDEHFLTAAS